MRRRDSRKGIIVAFSFGKGAYEEIGRAKVDEGIEIKAITVRQLIEGRNSQKTL